MNIHLPAILGFTRYQRFDPSPFIGSLNILKIQIVDPTLQAYRNNNAGFWRGTLTKEMDLNGGSSSNPCLIHIHNSPFVVVVDFPMNTCFLFGDCPLPWRHQRVNIAPGQATRVGDAPCGAVSSIASDLPGEVVRGRVRWPKSTKQVWNLSRFRDLREKLEGNN